MNGSNSLLLRGAPTLVLCAGALVLAAASCDGERQTGDVSQAQVFAWIEEGTPPLLLDVRSEKEYASGHVPGAVNIPHDQLASRLGEIDGSRDEEVVVYCERGGRAGAATETLEEAGFSSIRHLAGDMSAWRNAELPTEPPTEPATELSTEPATK